MGSNPGRTAALNEIRIRSLAALVDASRSTDESNAEITSTDKFVGARYESGLRVALILEPGHAPFGSAIVWAAKSGPGELTLLVDRVADPGIQARRASALASRPSVYEVDGLNLVPARPSPPDPTIADPEGVEAGRDLLHDAQLDVVTDHGVVIGEYLGLEVALVLPSAEGGEVCVGVGAVDREANRVLHSGTPPRELLARVIAEVAAHRRPGGARHPLGQMARERWMMHSLIRDPSQIGLENIVGVEPASIRRGLRTGSPAAGIASTEGSTVLVVATVGIDVALIGALADLVIRERPDRVVVATPAAMIPSLARSIEWLSVPVSVNEIEPPWAV